MATILNLKFDAAVYEYCSVIWEDLTGLTPEKMAYSLSAGKGVVGKADDFTLDLIKQLLPRVDYFVPRVRLDCEDGEIYSIQCRTLITRWRRKLVNLRTALLHSSKVIYLSDAVNQILARPYIDEISRLKKSIFEALNLSKSGQNLTEEQQQIIDSVNKKIDQQRKKLRELPRCTNAILKTLLHEVIDDMPGEERAELERLVRERTRCTEEMGKISEELNEVRTALRNLPKNVSEDEENRLTEKEKELGDKLLSHEGNMQQIRMQRSEILQKYYDHLKPEVVAESLLKAPSTFWAAFNMKINMIETKIKIASPPKKDKSAGKQSRKQPTLGELAEALILFPYKIGSADANNNHSVLLADLAIMDEYDQWTEQFPGKSITQEYRAKYIEFSRRFNTLPESALAALNEEPSFATQQRNNNPKMTNYDKLFEELKIKAGTDTIGLEALQKNDGLIKEFSELPDFEIQLDKIKKCLEESRFVTAAFTLMREILSASAVD